VKIFWKQNSLWFSSKEKEHRKNLLLFPNPKNYFLNIDKSLSKENLITIKKCYNIVNRYHKKEKTKWYSQAKQVKILNTFSFAPYVLWWFIITFLIQDKIFKYLINLIIETIKSFY
jgi:hypothetical protein